MSDASVREKAIQMAQNYVHDKPRPTGRPESSARRKPRRAHQALYGNVTMQREWCPACDGYALVIDNLLSCCDRPLDPDRPVRVKVKRMCEASDRRKGPSAKQCEAILREQAGRCLYCAREFGLFVYRNGKRVQLKLEWDHLIPYSYSRSCADQEFCAACHVCNGLKSATVYQTLEEARADLALKRERKGWSM